ncbi:MAG: ThuA domain-containing protein [Bacteroidales bacterium]
MKSCLKTLVSFFSALFILGNAYPAIPVKPVRILVVTGGHGYEKEPFGEMLASLGPEITYQIAELPSAFDMFLPQNRDKYDVLVFYHMWQEINPEQEKMMSECIKSGKPLVALHHSICAFDNWEEYWRIIGGKYFHKVTVLDGKEYQPCSYIHDLHFKVNVARQHPVTKGVGDFDIFDETYKGYWISPDVEVLLTTNEKSSNNIIGWTHRYGKAKVVVFQSGHATPTFKQDEYRKLLKQAVFWVYGKRGGK